MGIYIADVFWEYTTRRVLTLENVASIKIDDVAAIEAAGISRAEVARRLYDTYLEQIFVHSFVHADPHPGNLFVHPLPRDPGAPPGSPRPFWLIFVDFGMVAVIPESMRDAMRDVAIAVGTRDAHRLVQAYYDAGVLLPGADRQRIEELHEVLFARFGGVRMGQLSDVAMQQATYPHAGVPRPALRPAVPVPDRRPVCHPRRRHPFGHGHDPRPALRSLGRHPAFRRAAGLAGVGA